MNQNRLFMDKKVLVSALQFIKLSCSVFKTYPIPVQCSWTRTDYSWVKINLCLICYVKDTIVESNVESNLKIQAVHEINGTCSMFLNQWCEPTCILNCSVILLNQSRFSSDVTNNQAVHEKHVQCLWTKPMFLAECTLWRLAITPFHAITRMVFIDRILHCS